MATLLIIARPNGSGKTTFTKNLVHLHRFSADAYINQGEEDVKEKTRIIISTRFHHPRQRGARHSQPCANILRSLRTTSQHANEMSGFLFHRDATVKRYLIHSIFDNHMNVNTKCIRISAIVERYLIHYPAPSRPAPLVHFATFDTIHVTKVVIRSSSPKD